ncbi:MAG: hypothetical protein KGI68_04820, partial [Alphaproteobacteria bacterium]|nr:hypothetical protein [Alphaproteobacteria bacterium]
MFDALLRRLMNFPPPTAVVRPAGPSVALARIQVARVLGGMPFAFPIHFTRGRTGAFKAIAAKSPACVFPDRSAAAAYSLGVLCFVAADRRIAV